jgi:hypothetical protein
MTEIISRAAEDLNKVDASPTKAFFVDIITKDIQLDKAIHDLVDNCVDGAKRLRPGVDARYDGLTVAIEIGPDRFRIKDNCGGIPIEVARKYAFKFGRVAGFTRTSRSVGQFGVGMKRALFKMGDHFVVKSTEPESRFEISVDVQKWADDDTNWDFDLSEFVPGANELDQTGTDICVTQLEPGVAITFQQAYFLTRLKSQIRAMQQQPMRQGLAITVNNEAIIPLEWKLKYGEGITPAYLKFEDALGNNKILTTRLYAGIGESNRAEAGWYIFCNGRCILEADQEATTGWSQITDNGIGIPKYHGQFARFRGYAFLDADDSSILPWNTTKTGLDPETDAYRRLIGRLIEITRPVIDFLNELDSEKDLDQDDQILSTAMTKAPAVTIASVSERPAFNYTAPPKRGPPLVTISYKKPKGEVEKLQEALSANSAKTVGEQSFEYALSNLTDEN